MRITVTPQFSILRCVLITYFFPENHGCHYIALEGTESADDIDAEHGSFDETNAENQPVDNIHLRIKLLITLMLKMELIINWQPFSRSSIRDTKRMYLFGLTKLLDFSFPDHASWVFKSFSQVVR